LPDLTGTIFAACETRCSTSIAVRNLRRSIAGVHRPFRAPRG
jgi:hypothetical protein